jgi:hypothetical protein
MRTLFTAIIDGLTFKDIAGKRHPRIYTVLTGAILILLAIFAICVALEHKVMMDEVQYTPVPLEFTPEATLAPEPTQTVSAACPVDPTDWAFLDVMPNDNFKRIEPACVYKGLGKSVAWAMAVRSGYTRAEAAHDLGFADFPMRRQNEVVTLTNTKGPLTMEVSFTPPQPDFGEWRVEESGKPALAYALSGCFRTSEIVGNQAKSWNADYPVICVLDEDTAASRVVMTLDGHIYTAEAKPTRSFALFGYGGDGLWFWLGTQKEPTVTLSSLENYSGKAQANAGLYGAELWDSAWLSEQFGLSMKTLPDGWQSAHDEAELQAILKTLNDDLLGAQP